MADQVERIFIAGSCEDCGQPFVLVNEPLGGRSTSGARYCSEAHKRRAKKKRAKTRPSTCPVKGCGRPLFRHGVVVCGVCWSITASMCLGKRRLGFRQAEEVQKRRGWPMKWCCCCGWWHNTSKPAEDGSDLIARVSAVLAAMTEAKGRLWVSDLIESWDDSHHDRAEWSRRRAQAAREREAA